MKTIDSILLSIACRFYKERIKSTGNNFTAGKGTKICNLSVPDGTYLINEPINVNNPNWFEHLMSRKV